MSLPADSKGSAAENASHASSVKKLDVSIIIPAFNASETIAETLESVLAQSHPNWEAIVVDDGSNDETGKVVQKFVDQDSRVRLIRQEHGGEAAGRNGGIPLARYDWLLFLDADDWISPVHLERMTRELAMRPELDAVHCRSARVAPDKTMIVEKFFPTEPDLFPTLARRAAFNVHTCIVRKSLVEDVGMFDTSLKRLPDWDLWQKVARTGAHFGVLNEVLSFYRMRPNTASLDASQVLKDGLRVLKQGHGPDPRVPNSHPDHEKGMPSEGVRIEEYYFLSWCAGIVLGSGKDARPLLEIVKKDSYPALYAEAVAQCIFESAPLATCSAPQGWEKLAPNILKNTEDFLKALEIQTKAPNLADHAGTELRKLILKHSPTWQTTIESYEQTLAGLQNSLELLEKDRNDWKQVAEERERWRIHWQQVTEEKEKERTNWQQIAEERENWRIHWQQIANEQEQTVSTQNSKIRELEELKKRFWVRLFVRLHLLKIPAPIGGHADSNEYTK